MTKKKWIIAIISLLLLLSLGAGVWLFLKNRSKDNTTDQASVPTRAEALEDYASTATDPAIKASTILSIAGEAMEQKDYDKVISYSQKVLDQSDAPNDLKQVSRRNMMYAYNLKGNNSEAIRYAKEYKQNLSTTDPDLKVKEDAYIDLQITQLEANQALQTVGGAEEGD